MGRKTKEELSNICNNLGIKKLWSFSRQSLYGNDKWSYFLRYVKGIPEDRDDGIYGVSGGYVHDLLEGYYNKEIKKEDMVGMYEDELFNWEVEGKKYDRSDDDKNKKIAEKYEYSVKHFLRNHIPIKHKLYLEKFITIKIGDRYFQGYIDAFHKEVRDGVNMLVITDWKTSTKYGGAKIQKEAKQLKLYAKGIHDLTSIPYSDIIIRWAFLKYCTVSYIQANGKPKDRDILRYELGDKLQAEVRRRLTKYGCDVEEREDYINEMILTNSIEFLPKEVRDMFTISDCYVEIDFGQELIDELVSELTETLDEIEQSEAEYRETDDDMVFYEEIIQPSYFITNLSGYSPKLHKPYSDYLDHQKMFSEKVEEEGLDEMEELDAFLDSIL